MSPCESMFDTLAQRYTRATLLACFATWVALLCSAACSANSAFYNQVSSNGANAYTLCNSCNIQAPINPAVPNTIFHPNPINGYGSIQGVDVGPKNGAGLTVNAAADLALEATFTSSESTAFVEFTIDPLIPFDSSPVNVRFRGSYGYTDGGTVEATLWRGFRNCEFCSGTVRHNLFRSALNTSGLGIWDNTVAINPFTTYTLKLHAKASAYELPHATVASSRAFIDPVITAASGEALTIHFDSGTLTPNPNFVAPEIVPEPGALALLAGLFPAAFWTRSWRSKLSLRRH